MTGSIPARAGETASAFLRTTTTAVHPRACGGNAATLPWPRRSSGPSPRVRGKHASYLRPRLKEGSIPARAGETNRRIQSSVSDPVHPRACGGNPCLFTYASDHRGPSPRVRGKPVAAAAHTAGGSIPARAGETAPEPARPACSAVHPRACGGNLRSPVSSRFFRGPSPRVRGKRCSYRPAAALHGSIPARAGETVRHLPQSVPLPVHPRACGGNPPRSARRSLSVGPSPRVRGKQAISIPRY